MKETIVKLKSVIDNKYSFIYPSPDSPYMPNQFLAVIETNEPKEIGKILEDFISMEVKKLFDDGFKKLSIQNPSEKLLQALGKQINNFFKANWIAIPYKNDSFKEQYNEIQKVLRGIKNLNAFEQFEQRPGKKCNLCGERNSLFYNWNPQNNSKNNKNPFQLNIDNDGAVPVGNGQKIIFESGEGLCAVCFTKRYYKKDVSFPSTAKISLADTLDRMADKNLLEKYKKIFNNDFDEQLLYEENLTEYYFKKNNLDSYLAQMESIKSLQKQIQESLKNNNLKLTKYYALIKLDGDDMGKWLSGAFLGEKVSSEELMSFDMEVSKKLSEYAKNIENYFKDSESKGKLIYSGGDDVLAFVNLYHLVSVLKHIREIFPNFNKIKINGKDVVKTECVSTASCGVVIAHYKMPLQEALKWARSMECNAKKNNKDSCAIAVLKHSGDMNKLVFNWQYKDNSGKNWTIDLIGEVIEALKTYLSGSCVKKINQEFSLLSGSCVKKINQEFSLLMNEYGCFGGMDGIIESEIKRLIMRSNRESVNKKVIEKKLKELAEKLISYYKSIGKLDNFISLLNVSHFISKETSHAD